MDTLQSCCMVRPGADVFARTVSMYGMYGMQAKNAIQRFLILSGGKFLN
ncbi:hypothetical protein [Cupriavidus taiwanensis]|nr:hypothetical protein [Cupriavidus taiwanensis]